VTFNQERYESFIDLQDQLHRNLCRNRTLVAIGTHDYDTLSGPFEYHAKTPEDINFVPLTETERSFNAKELMDHYNTDPTCKHLKPYVPIIYDEPAYPVIYDSKGTVLSLPPIINGRHSRIQLHTKNVFIECTATDKTKANIVLDTVVAMFSEHCSQPFTVEPVDINYESSGVVETTPILFSRTETAKVDFVNSIIGIECDPERMVKLCDKMQLGPARLLEDGNTIQVTVPCTRSDILHAVDIAEDVGIAYGYNNIIKKVPQTSTVGGEQPLNHFGDLLRDEIARAGYTEVLTHGLVSTHDNFTALQKPVDMNLAVSLSNPANVEYEVIRTTLLPGLFKVLEHNKSASFTGGFKIFEISDVVLKDATHVVTESIVGAKNSRRLAAVYAGPTAGFEIIHGLVDRIMTLSEVKPDDEYIKNSIKGDEENYRVTREGLVYTIAEGNDPLFFNGRAADIMMKRGEKEEWKKVGSFGVVHPMTLKNFDIQYPASALELDLEAIM
jgi:phenylalanyl-tRNA synthetase beta chain